MDETYTVKVTFTHNLDEYEDPEDFVESCLDGNRASHFALGIEECELVDR